MRGGIYLGPPRARSVVWLRALVLLGLVATLVHLAVDLRQRAELESLRNRVLDADTTSGAATEWSPSEAETLWYLAAVSSSGAPFARRPSDMLSLVAEAIPENVRLVSVTLEPSGREPGLLLEAVAERPEAVSSLERRLTASPSISRTRLLEERRAPDGLVSVRLQAELIATEIP